jgi:hypothetical protein
MLRLALWPLWPVSPAAAAEVAGVGAAGTEVAVAHPACSSGPQALDAFRAHVAPAARRLGGSILLGEIAASGDLGFSLVRADSGAGSSHQGALEWVELWKRSADCGWARIISGRAMADGVSRAVDPVPGLGSATDAKGDEGAMLMPINGEAGARAIEEFEHIADDEGVAPALHVYALDHGFHAAIDGAPLTRGPGEASVYLTSHPMPGVWRDDTLGHSSDGSLLYASGVLDGGRGRVPLQYLQIWQYDPKVANFGLRLLWLGPAASAND